MTEPTCGSTRPKHLRERQTKCHSLLPLLWWQPHNCHSHSYLQKECPKSMGACCLAKPFISAATANSANGIEKICALLLTAAWCRQLNWSLSLDYKQGFPGARALIGAAAGISGSSGSWWELQEGAVQRNTFSSVKDVWRALLRKQYLGKAWKSGSQHFSLMLPSVTVTHRGVFRTLLLVCISLSPLIWLERSATHVTG